VLLHDVSKNLNQNQNEFVPIISSLCPLPMGTRESTHLIPVCIGSLTDCLGIIPGAFTSTLALVVVLRGPSPSMGLLDKMSLFRNYVNI